jgi:hypothetical protein
MTANPTFNCQEIVAISCVTFFDCLGLYAESRVRKELSKMFLDVYRPIITSRKMPLDPSTDNRWRGLLRCGIARLTLGSLHEAQPGSESNENNDQKKA